MLKTILCLFGLHKWIKEDDKKYDVWHCERCWKYKWRRNDGKIVKE